MSQSPLVEEFDYHDFHLRGYTVSAITQSAPPDNHFSGFKVHHFRMENRSLPGTANVLGLGTCPISSKCPNNSPFNP